MGKTVAAGVFLINKDKKLLICHPTNHKETLWSIPKGKVEDNESTLNAAIRETYEETNIDLSSCDNIIILDSVLYRHKKKILHPFLILETINTKLNWNSFDIKCNSNVPIDRGGFPEMDDYKWVDIEEARIMLHETQAMCLDAILETIKNVV